MSSDEGDSRRESTRIEHGDAARGEEWRRALRSGRDGRRGEDFAGGRSEICASKAVNSQFLQSEAAGRVGPINKKDAWTALVV